MSAKSWWLSLIVALVVIAAFVAVSYKALMRGSGEGVPAPTAGGAGAHCGGFIKDAPTCATGYHCVLEASRPDTGGTCVADTATSTP